VDEIRCELCGVLFDPRSFQVRVPGVPRSYHSVACALAARERLGLDSLARPARAHVERLSVSLSTARAQVAAERRRRVELEQELEKLAVRREAVNRRERERATAAAAQESALEAALAVGGDVPSGPLAEKLRRRWFERR
jgi:hypothetical protein